MMVFGFQDLGFGLTERVDGVENEEGRRDSDPGGLVRCLTLLLRQSLSEPSGRTLGGVRGGTEGGNDEC
jgi:hypothetical protein